MSPGPWAPLGTTTEEIVRKAYVERISPPRFRRYPVGQFKSKRLNIRLEVLDLPPTTDWKDIKRLVNHICLCYACDQYALTIRYLLQDPCDLLFLAGSYTSKFLSAVIMNLFLWLEVAIAWRVPWS